MGTWGIREDTVGTWSIHEDTVGTWNILEDTVGTWSILEDKVGTWGIREDTVSRVLWGAEARKAAEEGPTKYPRVGIGSSLCGNYPQGKD